MNTVRVCGSAIVALLASVSLTAPALADYGCLVFSAEFNAGEEHDVYLRYPDGSLTNLTWAISGDCHWPTGSPDGTKLAFYNEGDFVILDVLTQIEESRFPVGSFHTLTDWLDSDTLVYTAFHGDVHTVDIDGTNDTVIGGSPKPWAYSPRVSNDGSMIVCEFAQPYNAYSKDIYIHYIGTPGWVPLVTDADRDSHPQWSCDDAKVYYQHEEIVPSWDTLMCIVVETGEKTELEGPLQDWYLRDALPKCDELLIVRNTTCLHGRDIDTGAEMELDCAAHINTAQYMPCPPSPCVWDLSGDGIVNIADLLQLLCSFGPCDDPGDCPADFDGDGFVGVIDFLTLLQHFGPCPDGSCPWDVNGDGVVDKVDLQAVFQNFGPCDDPDNCPADVDGDGCVSFSDAIAVITHFGPCP